MRTEHVWEKRNEGLAPLIPTLRTGWFYLLEVAKQ